jgi:hypothetical protein
MKLLLKSSPVSTDLRDSSVRQPRFYQHSRMLQKFREVKMKSGMEEKAMNEHFMSGF